MPKISHVALTLLAGVFAFGIATASPPRASGQSALSPGCTNLNSPWLDMGYTSYRLPFQHFYAGEVLTFRADNPRVEGTISVQLDDRPSGQHLSDSDGCPGSLTIVVGQETTRATIRWQVTGALFVPRWEVSCSAAPSPSAPPPGPEMFMPLEGAVMGHFTHDTPAYWAPDASLPPSANLRAGQAAWVRGMDASGKFYQIVWVADLLWVPADAIGPATDDSLWQGALLPTRVVE